jgi:RNA polymerase sigma-70 factor (ECF subfamily)
LTALELRAAEIPLERGSRSASVPAAASDESLMAAVCSDLDEPAFEELARRHAARASRMAMSILGSRDAAEDAVQECFLRLVRLRGSFRAGAGFAPWFYTMLRNACRDVLRREGREPGVRAASGPADPGRTAEVREAARDARRAMDRLDGDDRAILAMRVHGGLDFSQIGRSLGITPDCARKRAQRALERLRRELSAWAD